MKCAQLVLLLWLATVHWLGAQSARAYENAAKTAFASKEYYAAMKYYEQVLDMDSGRSDLFFPLAEASRLFGAVSQSIRYYRECLQAGPTAFRAQALYGMAASCKTLGRYEEAVSAYEELLESGQADAPLVALAENEMEHCLWALAHRDQVAPGVLIERLSGDINGPSSEFAAKETAEGLVFSAFRELRWKDKHDPSRPLIRLMQTQQGRAQPLPVFNHPSRHTAHLNTSSDGQFAVFNYCDYVSATGVQCTLYFSKKNADGSWTTPVPLQGELDQEGLHCTQPCLVSWPGGDMTLFFISDHPGGKGGADLWSVSIDRQGFTSRLENLRGLNTAKDEFTPFFDPKNRILYFSSDGWPGFGGADVFHSTLSDAGWSAPANLGIPVNSSFNDLYYYPADDNLAYFASNRVAEGAGDAEACCLDVFSCKVLPLALNAELLSATSKKPMQGGQILLYQTRPEQQLVFPSPSNPRHWELQRNHQYLLVASADHHEPDSLLFNTFETPVDLRLKKTLTLKPEFLLTVATYDNLDGHRIDEADVTLVMGGNKRRTRKKTERGSAVFKLDGVYDCLVIAEREAYGSDTLFIPAARLNELAPGATLQQDFFLVPNTLQADLPIALYFDNDIPKPGEGIPAYDDLVNDYMNRENHFVKSFTNPLTDPAEKEVEEKRIRDFFDEKVEQGYVKLQRLAENLDLFLKNNYTITIEVQGFSSPLANEAYNLSLSKRRLASVVRYFRSCHNGIYAPYILTGQLGFDIAPLGESEVKPGVSDDVRNRRMSVYSVEASLERRSELISVRLHQKETIKS